MERLPLTPEVLVAAYSQGIFPMDVDGTIQWFSPDPRAIIDLDEFHIPRTLRPLYRRGQFEIRINTCFDRVIRACSDRSEGTWISDEIIGAYTQLHQLGLAHSVESFQDTELVGGLYGVAIGGAFFGESMFHYRADASKVTLVALVERMRDRGYVLLDVQFITEHLQRFGARAIPREEYLERLKVALEVDASFAD
ncbi:MAG: leucyl/phenylalanyl-tRNA--protein transferase [Planctomycetota bacterium]|nr:MAG: leucyl/phenylalanyl-tRNA--protein transferase [Planctomycetota bacterium]